MNKGRTVTKAGAAMADDDLAHELLFGIPSSDAKGRYHIRRYPKPGTERERRARAILARLLRNEAKRDAFYTLHVAALIDPLPGSRLEQKIRFVRRRGGHRSTARLELKVNKFFKNKIKSHPNIKTAVIIRAAIARFGLSRRRIVQAWVEFQPKSGKQISVFVCTYRGFLDA